jgi:hypothetical protein
LISAMMHRTLLHNAETDTMLCAFASKAKKA